MALSSGSSSSMTQVVVDAVVNATTSPVVNATATPSPEDAAAAAATMAYLNYLIGKIHTLQLFLLLGYGIMFALCVILVLYLRFNRHVAFKGDTDAARKIILPAFEPLLWVLTCTTGIYTVFFCAALATGLYTWDISKLATEVFYSGRQFVFLSVVVFMLQKSVSGPALRRTILITFVLSTYTIPIVWYMVKYRPKSELYTVLTTSRAFMLLLYTYIFIRPPGRASKRTIREFCLFAYVYYALLFAYTELFRQLKLDEGFTLCYANLLCGSLCPLVIWRVLKADTEHWRGMGQRAVALQRLFRQNNNLPERVSSKGLHVLIEMHRKYIIDFAYLELKQKIGVGASAVVFNGILKCTTPVAVKVYTPTDFNEDTVAGFSQEAALCGALSHPNIVKFYGMCVCPPTICLVSELCQGSLEDVTCAIARRPQNLNRQQLLINLGYMLDAARAVAYIHSFRPAFLHRDIKPANFLVDSNSNVKLTDFGESRSLPRAQIEEKRPQDLPRTDSKQAVRDMRGSVDCELESGANVQHIRGSAMNGAQNSSNNSAARMTVKGTVDYMAPEVINGKAGLASYGEAADVYSLGITMWDILNPGREKFPTLTSQNHFQIFQFVIDGQRPELDHRLHPSLRAVIESAWQPDPRFRPSAQNIVAVLESIQEELCAAFAMELSDELEDVMIITKQPKEGQPGSIEQSFSGQQAIDQMEHLQYVESTSEAIRLGNALMDAGLLHHLQHARPFENTNSVYYFDEENINLCQPLVVGAYDGASGKQHELSAVETLTQSSTTVSRKSQSRKTSQRTNSTHGNTDHSQSENTTLLDNGMCNCRKLGQRLHVPKPSGKRKFRRNKHKALAEDNILDARLLQEDFQATATLERHDSCSEFDDFNSVV